MDVSFLSSKFRPLFKVQAGGDPQIFPKKLHGQAGLRHGIEVVRAVAAQAGTRQGRKIKRRVTVAGNPSQISI